MSVLDQTQDLDGRELYRLTRLYSLPPFCKQASSQMIMGYPDGVYAYPPRRLYPCDTAAATYISTLFFLDKKAAFNDAVANYVQGQLTRYASYHGIGERIEQLKQAFAADKNTPEAQLSDDEFALVLDDGERHYPLRNATEVKAAAEFTLKNRQLIPLSYRQKMAGRILTKANEYGAALGDLDEFLEKQAGYGGCSTQQAAELLFQRARLLKTAGKLDAAIQIGQLAKTALSTKEAVHDDARRRELAVLVDRVDREYNLYNKFEQLMPPEDVLFGFTEKSASNLRNSHVSTISGNIYKRADLSNLKLDDIRDFMGDDFADAVSTGGLFVSEEKLAAIVPTLPLNDGKSFDRMARALGVKPTAVEAAHIKEGFSTPELVALAAAR